MPELFQTLIKRLHLDLKERSIQRVKSLKFNRVYQVCSLPQVSIYKVYGKITPKAMDNYGLETFFSLFISRGHNED